MQFSPAADHNKGPILAQLERLLAQSKTVLEVGSGSGQHAIYFATKLPHIQWQASDTEEHISDLQENIELAKLNNLPTPLQLDANLKTWAPGQMYDTVFTANTMHIMTQEEVEKFFNHLPLVLKPEGLLLIYGPFKYAGKYTSESNETFDKMLQQRALGQGLREFQWLEELASHGLQFQLESRIDLPANNQLLVFSRD